MKDHIGGGLVGVPVITRWAVRSHNPEFIYRMLKQRGYPGYLHMIDHGATATWEYWSGERSRVHNCYNGIGTWFYQALGIPLRRRLRHHLLARRHGTERRRGGISLRHGNP